MRQGWRALLTLSFSLGMAAIVIAETNDAIRAVLQEEIASARTEFELVGMGALIFQDGEVIATAVDGEREYQSGNAIGEEDRWHIGSVTKSFTGTLIGRLVEQGVVRWDTTVGDVFSSDAVHPDWQPVTLHQLITHTAGAKRNFSIFVHLKFPEEGPDLMQARETAVLKQLKRRPKTTPGSEFAYSNVGYTIAGVMLERVTGKSWETLTREEIFEPLNLTDAGFGAPPNNEDALIAPLGHKTFLGKTKPAKPDFDNTPIIGPAGTLHMTMENLARYADDHLKGERGEGKLMSAEAYQFLHQPNLSGYAVGWLLNTSNEFGLGDVFWHNGSNTRWFTLLVVNPEHDLAFVVATNDGRIQTSQTAAWQLIKKMAPLLAAP